LEWVRKNVIAEKGNSISLPEFSVQFPLQQQKIVDGLLRQFSVNPFYAPSIKDCIAAVGEEIFNALVDNEIFVVVSDEVVYRKEDYQKQLEILRLHFEKDSNLTVAQFRDLIQTSRRYALATLEHLDVKGITVRVGDSRRLKTPI
jgi:selenocysteine-specific elongation factor